MNNINLRARAKINLSIDVINKRSDGYHNIKMLMQSIKLHDIVHIEKKLSDIEIKCNHKWVPQNSDNIAFKAAKLLIDKYNIDSGVRIFIDKKIPICAGLAGGSSNAAAVLVGMNKMFKLNLSNSKLIELGKTIGADIPFCIEGGTMLAEGIGDKLTKMPCLPTTSLILVKPQIGISTKWVYENLKCNDIKVRPNTDLLINALEKKDITKISKNMVNVLEEVIHSKYPIINEIKNILLELGANGSLMSGSGSTVFGVFNDKKAAKNAFEKIDKSSWQCILTETI